MSSLFADEDDERAQRELRESGSAAAGTPLAERVRPRTLDEIVGQDEILGPGKPLHIVGFSNGGTLAVKYALDALDDDRLARPDRVILISPMIGITSFARFAGLAALPAILPAFAKAAWLGIVPEFNPFKYNSFPVNGARQSYRATVALQDRLSRAARDERLARRRTRPTRRGC